MWGWEGEEKNLKRQPAVSSSRGVGAGASPTSGGGTPLAEAQALVLSFRSRASPQIFGRAPTPAQAGAM